MTLWSLKKSVTWNIVLLSVDTQASQYASVLFKTRYRIVCLGSGLHFNGLSSCRWFLAHLYLFPPFLCAVGPVIMSIEEKMEADGRSIYVGNVSLMLKSLKDKMIVNNQVLTICLWLKFFPKFQCLILSRSWSPITPWWVSHGHRPISWHYAIWCRTFSQHIKFFATLQSTTCSLIHVGIKVQVNCAPHSASHEQSIQNINRKHQAVV